MTSSILIPVAIGGILAGTCLGIALGVAVMVRFVEWLFPPGDYRPWK